MRPTITEVAEQRVEVIKQRIMARDNLLAVMNKYKLFSREQASMSGTELLDLIRSRTEIVPVEPDAELLRRQQAAPTIGFTLSFDYEVPDLARAVANEFLTEILSEDANTRSHSAAETTKFLEREVERLQGEHDSVVAQIVALERQLPPPRQPAEQPSNPEEQESDEVRTQKKNLTVLEEELAQKSAVYSDEHPVIKTLKRNIEEQKRLIASEPQTTPAKDKAGTGPANDQTETATANAGAKSINILVLERQEANLEKSVQEANAKLNDARLGESMEKGQEGERLQVIEQPSLPQKPIRPQTLKWLTVAVALAAIFGTGSVILAETFDGNLRGSRDLAKIIDRHLIVTIPYISKPGEDLRRRLNLIFLCSGLVGVLAVAIGIAVSAGILVDFSWLGRF